MAKSRRTPIVLGEEDRERLERIKSDPHSILKHVQRVTIILHLGDGLTLSQTMRATGMSKPTVWRWWDRFLVEGVDGLLYDIPRRRERKPTSEDKVSEQIELAASSSPEHASHCTLRVTAAFAVDSAPSLHKRDEVRAGFDRKDQVVLPIMSGDVLRQNRDVVLSIRPQYSSRIMTGEKTVELRRRFPTSAPRGTIAYIYSTSPERAMVGHAEIVGVRRLAVEEIWRNYAEVACIEKADFDSYFEGLDQGYAVELANAHPFEPPLSLSFLREHLKFEPPQSFLYAKQDLKRMLKDKYPVVSH